MILQGQVAVVTGGATRLGKALVLALADAGCHVCVHYGRSEKQAAATAAEAAEKGVQTLTVQADLRAPETAAETIFRAAEQLGDVSILTNNAALFEPGTLLTTGAKDWERHFAINLQAPFFLCREFARRNKLPRRGHIVNIADRRASRPEVGHLAYTLTKSALVTLTRILALELAPEIRVNAIAPGAVLPAVGATPDQFERLAADIPLRQTGKPADIAEALLYLLQSEFLTGEVLHVSGGQQL